MPPIDPGRFTQNREVKPGNTIRSRVPMIELNLSTPTRLLAGEFVRWGSDRRVRGLLRSAESGTATIAITDGVRALDRAGMATSDDVLFVGLDPWEGRDPWAPDEVPWTHREATTSELAGWASTDPSAGTTDDSPDMSMDELGAIAIVGIVGPDDEPGALQ